MPYKEFWDMQVFIQFLTQNIWYLKIFDLPLQMKTKTK